MEQFATFMEHSKKTHEAFYGNAMLETSVLLYSNVLDYLRIYQTAKVAKDSFAVNKGSSAQYKGKRLDDVDVSDVDDTEEELKVHETDLAEFYRSEETGN